MADYIKREKEQEQSEDPCRAAAQKIMDAVARSAAEAERQGKPVAQDIMKNPNLERWAKTVSDGELLENKVADSNGSTANIIGAMDGFFKSPAFLHWKAQGKVGATHEYAIPGGLRGQSVRAVAMGQMETKAAQVATVTDIRPVLATDYIQGFVPQGVRQTRVRDLFTVLPTDAGAIKYLRETGFTNAAAAKSESTDPSSPSSFAASTITNTLQTATIQTLGHYIRFPQELMEDVSLLTSYLQARMESGLDDEEDRQLLHGSGTGADFTGLFNDSGVTEYSWSANGVSGDNRADAFLMAATAILVANYMPTGIAMSYTDWARIIKLKDSENNYLFPFAHHNEAPMGLWGLPVARSNAFTLGQGAVGAFGNPGAAYIADRMQTTVQVTDKYNDDIVKGLFTMVLRKRCCLVVSRPESFRQVSLNAAPSGSES